MAVKVMFMTSRGHRLEAPSRLGRGGGPSRDVGSCPATACFFGFEGGSRLDDDKDSDDVDNNGDGTGRSRERGCAPAPSETALMMAGRRPEDRPGRGCRVSLDRIAWSLSSSLPLRLPRPSCLVRMSTVDSESTSSSLATTDSRRSATRTGEPNEDGLNGSRGASRRGGLSRWESASSVPAKAPRQVTGGRRWPGLVVGERGGHLTGMLTLGESEDMEVGVEVRLHEPGDSECRIEGLLECAVRAGVGRRGSRAKSIDDSSAALATDYSCLSRRDGSVDSMDQGGGGDVDAEGFAMIVGPGSG